MDKIREQSLLEELKAGNITAFGPLYDAYLEDIFRFVSYRVPKKETAEDITSQIFLKALERCASYNPKKGSFRTWLYQITRNCIIDFYRQNTMHENIEDVVISDNEKSKQQIETNILYSDVQNYLQKLSLEVQEIIVLRIWEGLSYAEISEILGKSEASCKMSFSRGLKELRGLMPLSLFLSFYLSSSLL